MILNDRLGRVLRGVRRWRGQAADRPIPVDPELADDDWRHLSAEIQATVEAKGGPVAARRRARTIGLTYESLSPVGRLRFLEGLAGEYGHDDRSVDEAMDAVMQSADTDARRHAETELRAALQPPREALFTRLAGLEGGLPFLIELRSDLLPHRKTTAGLSALDADLRRVLESWFDVGLLRLERITWDTPASFLEKLIAYEAVHAIESWDDLKHRLSPGRHCYAFIHPGMPNDPLIFVEVALTKEIARELAPLLDREALADDVDEDDFTTAIFYSISNCHRGLAGVSLGDFLIKSVVEQLASELKNLKVFATLSPVPGFRSWLEAAVADGGALVHEAEEPAFPGEGPADEQLAELIGGELPTADDPLVVAAKPVLLRLAASYLIHASRGERATDPVAHFHLSNGARVEHLNWMGNPNPVGWERGLGMMVNYRYEPRDIERNHDRYVSAGEVTASDEITRLAEPPKV